MSTGEGGESQPLQSVGSNSQSKKGCLDYTALIARKNSVPLFIISGSLAVVISKLVYTIPGKGRHGDVHLFAKPWFCGWAMFVGMTVCLLVYQVERLWKVAVKKEAVPPTTPKLYWAIGIPALCDMVSSFVMNVGLLWISSSIWQMLRGSAIIFTAILKLTYRRRRLLSSEWVGMFIVLAGIAIVGGSAFQTPGEVVPTPHSSSASSNSSEISSSSSSPSSSPLKMAVGIGLVVFSQLLAAVQTIAEEKLLHDVKASPVLVVGMEGLWGLLLCSFISMPIAQHLPGPEGNGIFEDTLDSFYMLWTTPLLLGLNLAFVVLILVFNIYGMVITEETDAMVRNLLDPLRTLVIWVLMVLIHLIWHNYGESLNWWSFLQLFGFVVLVLGLLIYNAVLRFPCLKYKKPKAEKPAASATAAEPPAAGAAPDATASQERLPLLIEIRQQIPLAFSVQTPVAHVVPPPERP